MNIKTFAVEHWMNLYEMEAVYNIAETCVESLTVNELISIDGTDPEKFLLDLGKNKLTYGHIEGSPDFRRLVSNQYQTLDADNVLVTNGAIGANFLLLYSLIQPGDHVVAVHPTYQQLYDVPTSFGATVDLLSLREENNYLPDLNELKSLVNEKTKMIIINNPNNPSGAIIEKEMLEEIVEIARSYDAYILCDEVYRNLLQEDDLVVPSIVDLYEKGISTSSMSKVLSLAGLRLGWIAGPKEVITECFRHRDYTTISCGMLDDILAVHALKNYDKILDRNRKIIKENLTILDAWVEQEPLISYVKPRAGTTAMLKYDLPVSSEDFCIGLFKANGAFLTPGSCFDIESHVRIGYACKTEVLEQGLQKVSEYLRTFK
ncbi:MULTISPECIES: aminotransferase [Peribacillus]|uniref:aminotransferase n=1 Tax=Peribacillus TaxID=2675229 RepID=UPI001F4EF7BE|nr:MULTISPECIES: aminotransferase [unclassified Peribacillus]MCK1982763.1 aminotransferase [Peribacillus sp. Aquil_B1]MCK2010308.1 aminotransferase [Peribacillus sp. Aquil_B8]